MGTKVIEKKHVDAEGNETLGKKIQLSYVDGTLTASEITLNEDESEKITPYIVQPWKCNPDGTVEPFANEADAFAWAENNLHML